MISLNSIELANIDVPGAAGAGPRLRPDGLRRRPRHGRRPRRRTRQHANHFAVAFLSRHDSDWDLGYSAARVSGSTPDGVRGLRPLPPAPGRVLGRRHLVARLGTGSRSVSRLLRLPRAAEPAALDRRGWRPRPRRARSSSAARTSTTTCGLLAKAGVAWRPGRWELGATVTTGASGSGAPASRRSTPRRRAIGLTPVLRPRARKTGSTSPIDVPVVRRRAARRCALRRAPRSTSPAEWFSSVDPYDILQPEPAPIAGRPDDRPPHLPGRRRERRELRRSASSSAWETARALRGRGAQPVGLRRPSGTRSPRGTSPTSPAASPSTAGGAQAPSGSATPGAATRCAQVIAPPGQTTRPARATGDL